MIWLGKMAWRDSRSHRRKLLLFTSSISIGIGALVGLSSLSSTLQEAMDQQAAALLGADMALTSRQPFTSATEALIDSLGGVQARQVAFNSMIYLPKTQSTRLAQIRALSGPFPFYGELKTAPAEAAQSFRTQPHALVDEALMLQFSATVGDSIKIGDTVFLIGGRLLRIPGENAPLQRHPAAHLYPDVLSRRHSPDPTRQPGHLQHLLPLPRARCPSNSQVHPSAHPRRPPPARNHRETQGASRPHPQQPLPLLKTSAASSPSYSAAWAWPAPSTPIRGRNYLPSPCYAASVPRPARPS